MDRDNGFTELDIKIFHYLKEHGSVEYTSVGMFLMSDIHKKVAREMGEEPGDVSASLRKLELEGLTDKRKVGETMGSEKYQYGLTSRGREVVESL